MKELLHSLKAIAEPTRLRIVSVLERCELSVNELCEVLNQSQPRVSRHLKLLVDAGVLERHAEGTSAFYGLARDGVGRATVDAVLHLIDRAESTLARDEARLDDVRAQRGARASAYFAEVAERWDALRLMHVDGPEIEAAMLATFDDEPIGRLLDIGTGTGRILEAFADRIDSGLGIDLSRDMLSVARSRIDEDHLRHCSVRQADLFSLDIEPASHDVVILHHVLHFLDDPQRAIQAAARQLAGAGTMLIVDFAPHDDDRLRTEHAHLWSGFADEQITEWCLDAGLASVDVEHFRPDAEAGTDGLVVTMWIARNDQPIVLRQEHAA